MKHLIRSTIAAIAAATAAFGANIELTSSNNYIPMPERDGSFSGDSTRGHSVRHIYYIISEADYAAYTSAASPSEAIYGAFLAGELGEACLYDQTTSNGYSDINLKEIVWKHDDATGQDVNYDKYYGYGTNACFAAIYTYTHETTGAFYYIAQPTNIVTWTKEYSENNPLNHMWIYDIAINAGRWNYIPSTYTIYYLANEGTGNMPEQTATNGVPAKLAANAFSRDGYFFAGWAFSSDGQAVCNDEGDLDSIDYNFAAGESVNLYAVWREKSEPVNPNPENKPPVITGKSPEAGTSSAQPIRITVGQPQAFSVEASDPEGAGLTYKWELDDQSLGSSSDNSWTWTPEAKDAGEHRVGVICSDGEKTAWSGYWFVLVENPVPDPEEEISDGEQTSGPIAIAMPPPNYKVKFNKNGGKGKMKAQTFTYGKKAKLRKNAFTRSGYGFYGWAVSKANANKGIVAFTDQQKVSNLTKDGGTVTLYAVWAKPTYTVRFYGWAKGVTGEMADQTLNFGKSARLRKVTFKRKGYTFKGWATSKKGAKKGVVKYKNKAKVKNLITTGKTVKLYAVWEKKSKKK